MAREGIYVGGKEIVRRYVGDKLVWRKAYYQYAFARQGDVIVRNSDSLSLNFFVAGGDGNTGYAGFIREGKIKLNDIEVSFSTVQSGVYDGNLSGSYSSIKVTFFNQYDKSRFEQKTYGNAKFTITSKVYK